MTLELTLLAITLVAIGIWLLSGVISKPAGGSLFSTPTRNVKYLRITDYEPLPDKCDPHTCFMAIAWMLIECGYSKDRALSISMEFIEVLNLQLKGISELIEDYKDGALKPGEGKKLITQWINCYERNNHELLRRYLSELKESMREDGIPRVDPLSVTPDKYTQNAYPSSIWRNASSAARYRGVCPDPEFIEGIKVPNKILLGAEIEDTFNFLDAKQQRYHFGSV